jgi:hypothetical protein
VSEIKDVGQPPHSEYYPKFHIELPVGSTPFRLDRTRDEKGWRRYLYVMALTPTHEQQIRANYYGDPLNGMVLRLPEGVPFSSNELVVSS